MEAFHTISALWFRATSRTAPLTSYTPGLDHRCNSSEPYGGIIGNSKPDHAPHICGVAPVPACLVWVGLSPSNRPVMLRECAGRDPHRLSCHIAIEVVVEMQRSRGHPTQLSAVLCTCKFHNLAIDLNDLVSLHGYNIIRSDPPVCRSGDPEPYRIIVDSGHLDVYVFAAAGPVSDRSVAHKQLNRSHCLPIPGASSIVALS